MYLKQTQIKSLLKIKKMKKIYIAIGFAFACITANAQNGLENIIVEKYYVSDANDAAANSTGGVLSVGSVTYRLYVDMLPGYRFQAAYGVTTANYSHELRIETTTKFFNNEDYGSTSPTFTKNNARKNTVMLDSWLSVGAACNGSFGVLKSDDNGAGTLVNNFTPLLLQNTDANAGIPLTTQDGILTVVGSTPQPVTAVGITTEIAMFDNANTGSAPQVFTTTNGSWASLNGSVGPDSLTNKVLIAQITTDGVFKFELNIQIGTPTGGVENYVAQNPYANEIQMAALIYDSSILTSLYDNNDNYTSFSVYPNPAKEILKVEINTSKPSLSDNKIAIYSLDGKLVLQNKLSNNAGRNIETIDIASLTNGMYFIEITLNGITTTQKIVKN